LKEDTADGRALLTEILRAPGLSRARRLERGAVLPGGHLDLCGVGAAAGEVIEGLGAEGLRGLWLADNRIDAGALIGVLARHPGLEHLDVAGNELGGPGLARLLPAIAGHAGLRSLGLADNAIDGPTMGRLARVLEGTGVLHVVLGRRGGARANVVDAAATDAWVAALRRGPPWATIDLRGVMIGEPETERWLRAVRESRLVRFNYDGELGAEVRARLCHQANVRRVLPMPELERLRRGVPREVEVPPLPAAWAEDEAELAAAVRLMERLSQRPDLLAVQHPQVDALRRGVARVLREERREEARVSREARAGAAREKRREEDRQRVAEAGIRQRRAGTAPSPPERDAGQTIHELHTPRPCYVCKAIYSRLHFFYDRLCPACAADSYVRRIEKIDLSGCQAVVTGGRIKIGHEVALRLLRWGARVLVTSRFPRDTIRRFAAQPDFAEFAGRLQVHSLDMRAVTEVEVFAAHVVRTYPRVDVLINNAAQTVRRSPGFFAALAAEEARSLPESLDALLVAAPPAVEGGVPALASDEFGEPLDTRAENSWRLRLSEVGTLELLEVQLINVVAPFLLNARLRPVMARRRADEASFIINVSAPEGRFDRDYKSPFHPHTNMAKASLNMMTRTSAEEYAEDGIYMTSVDPGWASNENPRPIAEAMRARGFMPPLDLVDAAARVCDPVVRGRRDGELLRGVFLKDFKEISW
jgi:NAD(P)-dependent dehydrogenase (short-subunit alcohol dehydrogenase family)